jgi:hypothetical protein
VSDLVGLPDNRPTRAAMRVVVPSTLRLKIRADGPKFRQLYCQVLMSPLVGMWLRVKLSDFRMESLFIGVAVQHIGEAPMQPAFAGDVVVAAVDGFIQHVGIVTS